jgi:medium-chain acyl-[acyl-carrier-protein] hydrolase
MADPDKRSSRIYPRAAHPSVPLKSIPMVSTAEPLWFTGQRTNSRALLRLFCFPYAGGGTLMYRNWARNLPSTIEICRAQLPGREVRLKEPGFTRLEPLVLALAEAIWPYLDLPFAFFGHSMGGLIGFELARELRRAHGLMPTNLFISGRGAPQLPDQSPAIYGLPESEFIQEVRSLNGTPKEVFEHPELLRLMIPLIRSDFEVCQTYDYLPEPPLNCPITVFGGLEDYETPQSELEAWRDQTTAPFRLYTLPGDHFFIHASQPFVMQVVSQVLQASCKKALSHENNQ